jgi:hypothetical protein
MLAFVFPAIDRKKCEALIQVYETSYLQKGNNN